MTDFAKLEKRDPFSELTCEIGHVLQLPLSFSS
jgi:hypothetical protein